MIVSTNRRTFDKVAMKEDVLSCLKRIRGKLLALFQFSVLKVPTFCLLACCLGGSMELFRGGFKGLVNS